MIPVPLCTTSLRPTPEAIVKRDFGSSLTSRQSYVVNNDTDIADMSSIVLQATKYDVLVRQHFHSPYSVAQR